MNLLSYVVFSLYSCIVLYVLCIDIIYIVFYIYYVDIIVDSFIFSVID